MFEKGDLEKLENTCLKLPSPAIIIPAAPTDQVKPHQGTPTLLDSQKCKKVIKQNNQK